MPGGDEFGKFPFFLTLSGVFGSLIQNRLEGRDKENRRSRNVIIVAYQANLLSRGSAWLGVAGPALD